MRAYLLVAITAAIITYLATPAARHLAIRLGAITAPRDRDVHSGAIPRLGGVAVYFGITCAIAMASQVHFFAPLFANSRAFWGVVLGGGILVLVGVIDDIYDIHFATKIAGQGLAALTTAAMGVQIYTLPVAGVSVASGHFSLVITTVLIVAFINAVNFIDGLDGLAAGVVAVGTIGFFGYTYLLSRNASTSDYSSAASLISAALIGACLGFLPHNFYRARVFLGDSGAMLLGLVLASAAIVVTGQIDTGVVLRRQTLPVFVPILIPLAVLAIPLLDLVLAVIRRGAKGKSPFAADKEHLHHKFLKAGHSHRGAVILLYLWTAVIAIGTSMLVIVPTTIVLPVMGVGIAVLSWATFRWPHKEKNG